MTEPKMSRADSAASAINAYELPKTPASSFTTTRIVLTPTPIRTDRILCRSVSCRGSAGVGFEISSMRPVGVSELAMHSQNQHIVHSNNSREQLVAVAKSPGIVRDSE